MSDLTFMERRKLEQLFDMPSGYVLDFSNRTFSEFVRESTGRNIYDARYDYESGSKANRLRAFWQKEDNAIVGKLINDLLDYAEKTGPLADACRSIASRLVQGAAQSRSDHTAQNKAREEGQKRSMALARLKEEFLLLAAQGDRNAAGLALEKLLNELFDLFGLQPRQPFRVIGEQIDGSFELDGQVYLLESKWEKNALPEADLLIFRGKIEGKSTFTRGVFIALNDISPPARDAITRGKAPSFFIVNGHDLIMILSEVMSLTDFLRKRVRLLAEEGCVCVPFFDLA